MSYLSNYPVPFNNSTGTYRYDEVENIWVKISRKLREKRMTWALHGLTAVGLASEEPNDESERYHFRVRRLGRDGTPVYLTTTQCESEFMVNQFKGNQAYKFVRFSLTSG